MATTESPLQRFLRSRLNLLEETIRNSPEARFSLLHHPEAGNIQAVVMGIKPAAMIMIKNASELVRILNEQAGKDLFVEAKGVIGNPVGMLHVIEEHPDVFKKNEEVRNAARERRPIAPKKVLETLYGHEQVGLMFGFSRQSVRAFAKSKRIDPNGFLYYMLRKRLKESGESKSLEKFYGIRPEEYALEAPPNRVKRRVAVSIARKHVKQILQNLDEELAKRFPGNEENIKKLILGGKEKVDPERYFKSKFKPQILNSLFTQDPFFPYVLYFTDRQGMRGIANAHRVLAGVGFKEKIEQLKREFPAR
ncbi:MAG: hypothetical protein QXR53_02355 [Candidatus Norongarragalinales archaeon]